MAPRLIIEILSESPCTAALYGRAYGARLEPHALFGVAGKPHQLDERIFRRASEDDTAVALDIAVSSHSGGIPSWRVISLGNGRYIALTATISLPPWLLTAIRRHAAPQSSLAVKEPSPLPTHDRHSAASIVRGCKARLFRYASLFVLDCSELSAHVAERCPHSFPASVLDEVGSTTLAIVGDFGICLRIDATRLLCGLYSHTEADPELIATQMLLTLRKATCTPEISSIHANSFRLLDVSSDNAESECTTFIDAL